MEPPVVSDLHSACFLIMPDIVNKMITERNTDVNMRVDNSTPLHEVCRGSAIRSMKESSFSQERADNCEIIIKILLREGANINARDENGCIPLHFVCTEGRASLIIFMVDRGADLFAKNNFGMTPSDYYSSHKK